MLKEIQRTVFSLTCFQSNLSSSLCLANHVSATKRNSLACASAIKFSTTVEKAKQFIEASRHGNLVPLHSCIFSDQLTPIIAYRCLVREGDTDSPSFLFESVKHGIQGPTLGRYTIVGAQPTIEIVAKEDKVTTIDHENGHLTEELAEDPMVIPRRVSEQWKPQRIDELPNTFCGGWVGYFSYDTIRHLKKKKRSSGKAHMDDTNLTDIQLGLYDNVIVIDHLEKKAHLIHWVRIDRYSSVDNAYRDGIERLEKMLARMHNIDPPRLSSGLLNPPTNHFGSLLKKSNMINKEYEEAFHQDKRNTFASENFQVASSHRFERRTFVNPFEVYRTIRVENPSLYMAYIQARGCILVATSPQTLARVKKGGGEHKKSEDLNMNDDKVGDATHEKAKREFQDHSSCWDVLRGALPIRPASRDPKVKAAEFIDQIEEIGRGPYGGGFGWVSFNGEIDIASSLRTMVFPTNFQYNSLFMYHDAGLRREWIARLQVGPEIVADGIPNDENHDCSQKVAALSRVIDLAESTFLIV